MSRFAFAFAFASFALSTLVCVCDLLHPTPPSFVSASVVNRNQFNEIKAKKVAPVATAVVAAPAAAAAAAGGAVVAAELKE